MLFGTIYWFVSVAHYGVSGFFLSQLLAISLSFFVSLYLMRRLFVFHLSKSIMKTSLHYALPQFPARIGSATNAYANRFFILGYLDTYHVGLFSMALKIGSIMQLVHQTFMMAWNQYMFEILKKENSKFQFSFIFQIIVPITFLFSMCLSLFSAELIMNFASPKFVESAKYVGCITMAISLLIVKEVVDVGPKYKSKTYYLSISFLSALGVNLISSFCLVKYLGLDGIVYSMILANLVLLTLSWIFSYRLYPIYFSRTILIISMLPVLLLTIFMIYVDISFYYRCLLLPCAVIYYFILIFRAILHYKRNLCLI